MVFSIHRSYKVFTYITKCLDISINLIGQSLTFLEQNIILSLMGQMRYKDFYNS